MRDTLTNLVVNNVGAEHIYDILLPDIIHKQEFTTAHVSTLTLNRLSISHTNDPKIMLK